MSIQEVNQLRKEVEELRKENEKFRKEAEYRKMLYNTLYDNKEEMEETHRIIAMIEKQRAEEKAKKEIAEKKRIEKAAKQAIEATRVLPQRECKKK